MHTLHCATFEQSDLPSPLPPNQHHSKMPHFQAFSGVEWNFSFFNRLFRPGCNSNSWETVWNREKGGGVVSHWQELTLHLMLWPVWHILWPIAPDIMSGEQTSTLTFSVSKGCISCFDNSTREYYTGRKWHRKKRIWTLSLSNGKLIALQAQIFLTKEKELLHARQYFSSH